MKTFITSLFIELLSSNWAHLKAGALYFIFKRQNCQTLHVAG